MTGGEDLGVDVLAAGAVLWRTAAGGDIEVALVHRPRYDDWSLPKGKLDRGESLPAAAVREVTEETGFAARLGHVLGDVRYDVPEGRKLVRFWAAQALQGRFAPGTETDQLRWCGPADAAGLLSYRRDAEVLDRFTILGLPSAVVLLVRHAKAGSRAQWDGPDDLRPLSGTGRDQAQRLAELLVLFGPDRILSAPPVRCRETVAPLAAALGLEVADEPLLGEDGYRREPALGRLGELAARAGVSVVCSQGGVIPDLVGALTGKPDDIGSPKASTWALAMRDGALLAADHYPRPGG